MFCNRKFVTYLCLIVVLCFLGGCGEQENSLPPAPSNPVADGNDQVAKQGESPDSEEKHQMQIAIQANGTTIIYQLNNSQAAKDLYAQLPLTAEVENFSTNEKIFYPPQALNTTDTPLANTNAGTLAYYEPWDDVVMFYDDFHESNGLYALGEVVSGNEYIANMSGTIEITAVDSNESANSHND